jgi:glycerol kinase
MNYYLAIDEGTSSARAIVFSEAGEILAIGRRNFSLYYPQPGWVEQEAEEIWQAQYEAVQEALRGAGLTPERIAAVGITNQRETVVAWDRKTGRPLHRAIVWQDRRTADRCTALKPHEPALRQKTGLVVDPYFSATKVEWLLKEAGIPPTAAFGNIDSWLLYKMCGIHATDVSNASRTLLYNLHTHAWDEELLALFNVPKESLPVIYPSGAFYGETAVWGGKMPVWGVIGDQQAALYGHGCQAPGQAKNTYGTGCFLLKNIGPKPALPPDGLLLTVAWQVGKGQVVYAWEGAVFSAAAALQWLEKIGLLSDYKVLDTLEGPGREVFFVPAFTGLGAPYWDPYARGLIIGLTRDTEVKDLLLSALEAMAYQSAEVLELMGEISELRVDGGVSVNPYLMQFQADISGVPIVRAVHAEVTAWGAASLAAHAAGLPAASLSGKERFIPRPQAASRLERWKAAVHRAMHWAQS